MEQSVPSWFKFNRFGQLEYHLDIFGQITTQFGVVGFIQTYMDKQRNIVTNLTNFEQLGRVCTIMDQIIYERLRSPLDQSGPV